MRLHLPAVAALAVLAGGWCAAADSSTSADSGTIDAPNAKLTPQGFVDQAASAGMLEVQSSKLALTKGVDQKVRGFAQRMIDDHQKAGDELKQLASRKGWTVKPTLASDDQKLYDKLEGYTGEEFSHQYAKLQVKAHDDAVALFTRGSRDLQDPDLKQFAQKYLPTLQEHRQMAIDLKGQEKSSKAEGWKQGGAQSGTVGSDSWSSQSSAPGGMNGSSSQGSSSGSLGTTGSTTIESDIHGTARMPGDSGAQTNGQTNGSPSGDSSSSSSSTYRDQSQQRSDVDSGVSGSSQNQSNMYRDDQNQPKSGTGY
jgi:putative membrane protein